MNTSYFLQKYLRKSRARSEAPKGHFNPTALKKAKTAYNFGLFDCNRVNQSFTVCQQIHKILAELHLSQTDLSKS